MIEGEDLRADGSGTATRMAATHADMSAGGGTRPTSNRGDVVGGGAGESRDGSGHDASGVRGGGRAHLRLARAGRCPDPAACGAARVALDGAVDARSPRPGRSFTEAVIVQLANPKAAVFMLAFYPQFVPADRPLFATTASLALLQVALETALYLALAAGVARAGSWFRRPKIRRRLEATSGTVLVGLGVRVAASSH